MGSTAESWSRRWLRRAITLPGYAVLCLLSVALLPLFELIAVLADRLRGGPAVLTRCIAFFVFYLCCEVVGVFCAFGAWLLHLLSLGRQRRRYLEWNFALECWWARTLLAGAKWIFAMHVEAEHAEVASRGPLLLFIRHASVGDTLLPAVLVSNTFGIRLRYVLKRELLWDPCLDIVGNRLPNYFARRGSGDSEREVRAVQQLSENLGPADGVLIYPEGTRFTPAKQAKVIDRLARSLTPDLLAQVKGFRHVLPPRLGGVLGLIDRNPNADVVFCAHSGFEGAGTFHDLLKGTLVNAAIRVHFWRVAASEIPTAHDARVRWLFDQWQRVDEWVEEVTRLSNREQPSS
ncbi:MAG: 1-acyl-sn-glycerol-3-phosphate acyltransferase [Deltaproteobacteria bacterium]|nr:1-acyl-sn-glycerol-3-phosphate acyltransferase [Deltaproteobacteria bacterium]